MIEQKNPSVYDYDACRALWQRVSPSEDPYPAAEEVGTQSGELSLPGAEGDPCCMGTEAVDSVVTNMEELNEAFGGNHLINGQTLILQENVELDHDIMIDYFVGNNCIIDLNGKTIKKNSGYFLILGRALEAGADFVQLIGKGRIVSDEGAYLFLDDSAGYRLILSGDIVYRTSGEFFTTIKNLTIENGDFKEIARTNESGVYIISKKKFVVKHKTSFSTSKDCFFGEFNFFDRNYLYFTE